MNLAETIRRVHPLHRLRRLPFFQRMAHRFDPIVPWRLSIFPQSIYLRPLAHGALMAGALEQEQAMRETLTAILRALPLDGGAFWDVGANIGQFTWLCATVRPDMTIVSFEPDQKNLACLERTSRRWQLQTHVIVPCAVAERSGRTGFLVDPLSGATGTLEDSGQQFNADHYGVAAERVDIATISLDDFLETAANPPQVVKIDVEGAELRVFEGAKRLTTGHQPVFMFESFTQGGDIVRHLQSAGYRCFDADRRKVVTPETINFVAVAPEKWPAVIEALDGIGFPR
jgi:FkbM family methyltransferase